jgi:hypothetical protein
LRGEAVVVEVAPGKYLFALLNDGLGWAQAAYDKNQVGSVFEENMRFIEDQSGQPPVPLPRANWPLMVTFDDVEDPKTVRMVDPDNLAATFGPGVELGAVTLEVTGDPVTEGRVERVLGWLGDYATNRWRLNGTRCVACPVASEALADLIDSSDFKIFGR